MNLDDLARELREVTKKARETDSLLPKEWLPLASPEHIDWLLDERDELRKYAQHLVNCEALLPPFDGTTPLWTPRWNTLRPCDCGLVDLFS